MNSKKMNKRFKHKFTGAIAQLFAAACSHYSDAAESSCNDTPEECPIFVRLSPQQRVHLVSQVAVGLLCPDEPLPPDTMEHYAAYLGVIGCLQTELEIELDCIGDFVEKDLLKIYNIKYPKDEDDRNPHWKRTEEEMDQRALVEQAARRAKKKLEKQHEGRAIVVVGQDDNHGADNEKPFSISDKSWDIDEFLKNRFRLIEIFHDGPCSFEQRQPPRPLTEMETSSGFKWRLLCDAAFQAHTTSEYGSFPPLNLVNFCWNSNHKQKWISAVSLLFLSHYRGDLTREEKAIQSDIIEGPTYADRSQHARIREVNRVVQSIRSSYDKEWDPNRLAEDQRLIFAICDTERHWEEGHEGFVLGFERECNARGFELASPNKYQERLYIYRSIKDAFPNGLELGFNSPYGCYDCPHPKDYVHNDCAFSKKRCNNVSCFETRVRAAGTRWVDPIDIKDLKRCKQCRVVRYCSKECQKIDWKTHKKQCKNLALWQNDENKIGELAKTVDCRHFSI